MPLWTRYAFAAVVAIVLAVFVTPLIPVAGLSAAAYWILLLAGIGLGCYALYLLVFPHGHRHHIDR